MREAIRQRLIAAIPEIGDRCYDPNAPDARTLKPYLVLRQGPDVEDSPWAGWRRIVEVWPCISRTSFNSLDGLADRVALALHGQLLTTAGGEVFTCIYDGGAGQDVVDETLDIITRGIRFAVLALQPAGAPAETEPDDPWLTALAAATTEILGAGWQVYLNSWPLGYRRPAVMWRLAGIEVGVSPAAAVFEVRKKVAGHVLGDTPNRQVGGLMTLVVELQARTKVLLDAGDRRYMAIKTISGNYEADALKSGQIALMLVRRTTRPAEEVALIQHVGLQGVIKNAE